MGYIDLLSRLTSDKRQELYLQNMKSSSEHLLALVNSLLDFYRLDANKMEVDAVAFNPAQLFETIRAGFAAAAAKGLELRLELAPGTDREVAGDAFRIRQIADNLLSNALKFTDEGFVTLRTRLSDGQLVFSVRDTGRGIGPEERERIFAEFVRLRSAQGVDGFGLGLSIVDRLVKLLGGAISLDSAPGQGSKFIVTVPVGDAAEGAAGRTAAPEPGAAEPLPPLRALLVDDDPCNSKWSPPCAAARGFGRVLPISRIRRTARRGQPLRSGRHRHPDALVRRIRCAGGRARVAPGIPVVAVSARGEMRPEDFAARGFAACLRKPFTYGELVGAIRAACCGGTSPQVPDAGTKASAPEPDGGELRFDALTAYAGDDAEAAQSILASFAEQTAANCTALCKALDADDAAGVKALAHKMLPIFTMLGAGTVADTLRRAETHEGALTDTLRRELAAVAERIRGIAAEAGKRAFPGKAASGGPESNKIVSL